MFTAAIARYLAAQGLVTFGTAGADCFLEDLPATPEDAVGIYTLPGGGDTLEPWGWMNAQLVVRTSLNNAGLARTGYERLDAIRDALHGLQHVTLAPSTPDELRLLWCLAATRYPVGLGRDEQQRPKWGLRVNLYVAQSGTHTIP